MEVLPTTAFGGGGPSRTGDGERGGNREGGCVIRCEGGGHRGSISAPFLTRTRLVKSRADSHSDHLALMMVIHFFVTVI